MNSPISLWGEDIETVAEEFCYLGSVISRVREADKNINVKITKTSFSFRHLQPVWRSRQLSLNTMLRIFSTNVESVLLYGCEIKSGVQLRLSTIRVMFLSTNVVQIPADNNRNEESFSSFNKIAILKIKVQMKDL